MSDLPYCSNLFQSETANLSENLFDEFDHQHLWHPYASLPAQYPNLVIDHADGIQLYCKDGTALIDGMSSWWAAVHGYNHPKLNAAITGQIAKMAHVMFGGLTHQPAIDLGKRLLELAPNNMDAIFYADSGSIAVEVALKMALQYQISRQSTTQPLTRKNQIATTRSGYYGDTWHAMSICDPVTGMHSLYGQQLPVQLFTDMPPLGFDDEIDSETCDSLKAFFERHHASMAAFIIEPIVQGAGGMRFYSPHYLKCLRQLCDQYDVLLIADEIATGFGRTGQMFACGHADINPDIMTVGKALTGGYMTFAATLCSRQVAEIIHNSDYPALMHGPTFMGNPLACAVANASLALILDNDYPNKARQMQVLIQNELAELTALNEVKDVRCLGAIGVIEVFEPVEMPELQPLLIKNKIWIRPFGKLVYIMPPLIMTEAELIELCSRLKVVLSQYFARLSNI